MSMLKACLGGVDSRSSSRLMPELSAARARMEEAEVEAEVEAAAVSWSA